MANTYYKYAERSADSYVNWAEIGKNMSDMFQNENKIREEKKAAIDEASRQYGLTLAEPPQGEHKGMNQWALEYSNDAQQARLTQDKLLKSGRLKLKDYLVQRQNLTDGTSQAFDLVKGYQDEFTNKMDRLKNEQSQDLESYLMSQAEGFSNFNNTKLFINPTDYTISIGKMVRNEKTGVMELSKDPNDFTTVSGLKNRIKGTFDRFDVQGNINKYVDALGVELNSFIQTKNSLGATGTIREVLDITNRKNLPKNMQGVVMNFEQAETKSLESYLSNPYNISSILTNSIIHDEKSGQQYTFTWNEEEAKKNSNLILLKNDPKSGMPAPQFSKEQHDAALERLRLEARMMYDKKSELKTTPQIQLQEKGSTQRAYEQQLDEAENFARQTSLLLTGNDAESADALKYFRSKGANIVKNPAGKKSGIYIENKAGEMVPFESKGDPMRQGRAIIGGLKTATGFDIPDEMITKKLPNFMGKSFNTTYSGTGTVAPRNVEGEFENKIVGNIDYAIFKDKEHKAAAPLLLNQIGSIPGISIKPTGWNNLTVTYTPKIGKPKYIILNTNQDTDQQATDRAEELKKFLRDIDATSKERAIGPEVVEENKEATPAAAGGGVNYSTK